MRQTRWHPRLREKKGVIAMIFIAGGWGGTKAPTGKIAYQNWYTER